MSITTEGIWPINTDKDVKGKLKEDVERILGKKDSDIKDLIDNYYEDMQHFTVKHPFPVVGDGLKVETDKIYKFHYKNKIFSGKVSNKDDIAFDENTLVEHLPNGTTRDKVGEISIYENKAYERLYDDFWGKPEFWRRVPLSSLVRFDEFRSVLQPYHVFITLLYRYKAAKNEEEKDIKNKIQYLLYASTQRDKSNGKRPRPIYQAPTSTTTPSKKVVVSQPVKLTRVDTNLEDVDAFRLKIHGKYNTIYDLMELLDKDEDKNLTLLEMLEEIKDQFDKLFKRSAIKVAWEHLEIPVTSSDKWNTYNYKEKVFIICRHMLPDDLDSSWVTYAGEMDSYGQPSVLLSLDDYTVRRSVNTFGLPDKEPLNFDISEADEYYKKQISYSSILSKPWRKTRNTFKIYDRNYKQGCCYADFIYLDNGREIEACKRLWRIQKALDLSMKHEMPVMDNRSSVQTPRFQTLTYLPRMITKDSRRDAIEYYDGSDTLTTVSKGLNKIRSYKVRENDDGFIPNPLYPSREKLGASEKIHGARDPKIPVTYPMEDTAALHKKRKLYDNLILEL